MFFVRIDDRYIHGQVGVAWAGYLQITDVLLANDDILKDPLACMMQKLSVATLNVIIKDVENSAKYLTQQPESKLKKTLVIVSSPQDVIRIIDNGFEIKHVNIGHTKPSTEKHELVKYFNVDSKDLEAFKELQHRGVRIEFQLVPNNKPATFDFDKVSI